MKNRSLLTLTGLVLLTGSSALRGGAGQPATEFKEDLNGAQGKVFRVDLNNKCFELLKTLQILQRTGAKLIWCTTTPVPNSSGGKYGRQKGDSVEFNKAAMEVVRKHPEIQTNDLHKVVNDSPAFDRWRKGSNVHFGAAEQPILGKAVADAVIAALKSKSEAK